MDKRVKLCLKTMLLTVILFVSLILSSCTFGDNVNFTITGVDGYSEAIIDSEEKTIKFSVDNQTDSFDINDIKLPQAIEKHVYSDSERTTELEHVVSVVLGENTFYLSFYFQGELVENSDYTLIITRLSNEKGIKSIDVKTLKDSYFLNETFEEGVLTVTYTDDTTEDIAITESMVSGFSTETTGEKTVTITYRDFTKQVTITVNKQVSSIAVKTVKTEYQLNETFTDGELTVTYDDTTTEDISLTSSMLSGFDTTTVGEKTVTVTYLTKTTTFNITVSNDIDTITVKSLKSEYDYQDAFSNGTLTVTYKDGTTEDIALTIDMVSNFSTSVIGERSLTITYLGKTISYDIVVKTAATSLAVDELQIRYSKTDDTIVGKLAAFNENGDPVTVEITSDMITGFVPGQIGYQMITITYGEKSVETKVFVQNDYEANSTVEYGTPTELEVTDVEPIILNALGYLFNAKDEEAVIHSLEAASVTKEQLAQLKEIYNGAMAIQTKMENAVNDYMKENPEYMGDPVSLALDLLTVEDADTAKVLLKSLISVFTSDQIAIYLMESAHIDQYTPFMNLSFTELPEMDELIKYLNDNNLTQVSAFINSLESIYIRYVPTAGSFKYLADYAYIIIDAITMCSSEDILNTFKFIINISTNQSNYLTRENVNADILKSIKSIGRILEKIGVATNDFDGLLDFIEKEIVFPNQCDNLYDLYNTIVVILTNCRTIGRFVQTINEEDIELVFTIMTMTDSTTLDYVQLISQISNLSKKFVTLIDDLGQSTVDSIIYYIQYTGINVSFSYKVIALVKELALVNPEALTLEKAQEYFGKIGATMSLPYSGMIMVQQLWDIVVDQNTTLDDFIKCLNTTVQAMYIGPNGSNMITFTVSNISTPVLDKIGKYPLTLSVEGIDYKLYYYVVSNEFEVIPLNTSSFPYIWEGTDSTLFFTLNSDKPSVYNKLDHYYDDNYIFYNLSIEQFLLHDIIFAYYSVEYNSVIRLSSPNVSVSYLVDTTTTGEKIGSVVYTSTFGNYYIPIAYTVIDENEEPNLDLRKFSHSKGVIFEEGKEITINDLNLYGNIYYSNFYDYISNYTDAKISLSPTEIVKVSFDTVGTYEIYLFVTTNITKKQVVINFNLNVFEEEDTNKILEIKIADNYKPTYEHAISLLTSENNYNCFYVSTPFNDYNCSFSSLKSSYRNYYNKAVSLTLQMFSVNDSKTKGTLKLIVIDASDTSIILETKSIEIEFISEEEFNKVYEITMYNSSINNAVYSVNYDNLELSDFNEVISNVRFYYGNGFMLYNSYKYSDCLERLINDYDLRIESKYENANSKLYSYVLYYTINGKNIWINYLSATNDENTIISVGESCLPICIDTNFSSDMLYNLIKYASITIKYYNREVSYTGDELYQLGVNSGTLSYYYDYDNLTVSVGFDLDEYNSVHAFADIIDYSEYHDIDLYMNEMLYFIKETNELTNAEIIDKIISSLNYEDGYYFIIGNGNTYYLLSKDTVSSLTIDNYDFIYSINSEYNIISLKFFNTYFNYPYTVYDISNLNITLNKYLRNYNNNSYYYSYSNFITESIFIVGNEMNIETIMSNIDIQTYWDNIPRCNVKTIISAFNIEYSYVNGSYYIYLLDKNNDHLLYTFSDIKLISEEELDTFIDYRLQFNNYYTSAYEIIDDKYVSLLITTEEYNDTLSFIKNNISHIYSQYKYFTCNYIENNSSNTIFRNALRNLVLTDNGSYYTLSNTKYTFYVKIVTHDYEKNNTITDISLISNINYSSIQSKESLCQFIGTENIFNIKYITNGVKKTANNMSLNELKKLVNSLYSSECVTYIGDLIIYSFASNIYSFSFAIKTTFDDYFYFNSYNTLDDFSIENINDIIILDDTIQKSLMFDTIDSFFYSRLNCSYNFKINDEDIIGEAKYDVLQSYVNFGSNLKLDASIIRTETGSFIGTDGCATVILTVQDNNGNKKDFIKKLTVEFVFN